MNTHKWRSLKCPYYLNLSFVNLFADQAPETAGNICPRRSNMAEDCSVLHTTSGEERSASGHSRAEEHPPSCQTNR